MNLVKKFSITYTNEFKEKVFQTLRFTPFLTDVMAGMEENAHTKVRYALEDALDDQELYIKDEVNDDGERIVANAKIHAWTDRRMIYSEFMEMYVQELDSVFANNTLKVGVTHA